MISLQGQLERITYQHDITHYTIGKVRMDDGHRLVTVVGHMAGVQPGDSLRIEGVWVTHEKYGEQFKVGSFEVLPSDPLESVRKFLYSGFVKGIGPKMARKLLSHFDAALLDVMDTEDSSRFIVQKSSMRLAPMPPILSVMIPTERTPMWMTSISFWRINWRKS